MMGNSKTKPSVVETKESESNTTIPHSSTSSSSSASSSTSSQLQVRNCIRNSRGNSANNFAEIYPDLASAQCNRTNVYTIDIGDGGLRIPSNFANEGYVPTESAIKSSQVNDGLPSYEEAIGITTTRPSDSVPTSASTNQLPNAEATTSDETQHGRRNRRRHRHGHNRHHHHHRNDEESENNPNVHAHEGHRRRHRRKGFRLARNLAKMGS